MEDAVRKWRKKAAEYGDEEGGIEWARQECERYLCSSCGEPHLRGQIRCDACGRTVSEDGWISAQPKEIELDE